MQDYAFSGFDSTSINVPTVKISVESVSLNKTELTLDIGGEDTLTATVLPDNADDKTVTWSVAPAGVVTVENGKVTAVAEGTATITATADGESSTCSVTVAPAVCYTVTEEEWNEAIKWRYKNLTYKYSVKASGVDSDGSVVEIDDSMIVKLLEDGSLHQTEGFGWGEYIYQVNADKTVTGFYNRDGVWELMDVYTLEDYEENNYSDSIGIMGTAIPGFVYDSSYTFDKTTNSYKKTMSQQDVEVEIEIKFENKKLVLISTSTQEGQTTISLYDYGTTTIEFPNL